MNFWVVDTEDNSAGGIYWINFYNGKDHFSFKTRSDAVKFLGTIKGKIFAVNLEYDIGNIFGDDLTKVKLLFNTSRLLYAQYRRCYFYDTLNHWKLSVADMGILLDFEKLPFNPKNLDYCRRDCEVTYLFTAKMLKIYDSEGMKFRCTLPSTVFWWWKEKFYSLPKTSFPKNYIDEIRQAYFGGRTESFFIGKYYGAIKYIDVNSMYPYVMIGEFPDPYTYIKTKDPDLSSYGLTYADVTSALPVPVLPYRRKDGRLMFPNGSFSGLWSNIELDYFRSIGGTIRKIHYGYKYPISCDPFTSFVDEVYTKRMNAKDEFQKYTYKLSMNSLYGKFGQGNDEVIVETVDLFKKRKSKDIPDTWKIYNGLVIYTKKGEYPIHSNFLWSIYVTAKARILLHKKIIELKEKGNIVLYCDTDSIIFSGSISGIHLSKNIGDFKLEGEYTSFNCKQAKVYSLSGSGEDYVRVKGVPAKHRKSFFETGKATYKKPLRIRESLRRNLAPNLWLDHSKVMVSIYDKGIIKKDGFVIPHKI